MVKLGWELLDILAPTKHLLSSKATPERERLALIQEFNPIRAGVL